MKQRLHALQAPLAQCRLMLDMHYRRRTQQFLRNSFDKEKDDNMSKQTTIYILYGKCVIYAWHVTSRVESSGISNLIDLRAIHQLSKNKAHSCTTCPPYLV